MVYMQNKCFRGNDPREDTASARSHFTCYTPLSVSGATIRERILQGSAHRINNQRTRCFRGNDPREDTARYRRFELCLLGDQVSGATIRERILQVIRVYPAVEIVSEATIRERILQAAVEQGSRTAGTCFRGNDP